MSRKDFQRHNTPFVCGHCSAHNPAAPESERNHCRECLYSLHVDSETPGDRASSCNGLMMPIALEHKGAKGFMIVHECLRCRKRMPNRAASDDSGEMLAKMQ